jgi:hypothetical protein
MHICIESTGTGTFERALTPHYLGISMDCEMQLRVCCDLQAWAETSRGCVAGYKHVRRDGGEAWNSTSLSSKNAEEPCQKRLQVQRRVSTGVWSPRLSVGTQNEGLGHYLLKTICYLGFQGRAVFLDPFHPPMESLQTESNF